VSLGGFFGVSQTTGTITVRIAPRFLAEHSDPASGRWVWSYHVRIENHGSAPVQLLRRHWTITDGDGRVSEVDGEGVVGEQPLIPPGGSFDYVSGCPLPTPRGAMVGRYLMESEGRCFEVQVPSFMLTQSGPGAG
jgi:ApaG protein